MIASEPVAAAHRTGRQVRDTPKQVTGRLQSGNFQILLDVGFHLMMKLALLVK